MFVFFFFLLLLLLRENQRKSFYFKVSLSLNGLSKQLNNVPPDLHSDFNEERRPAVSI